MTFKDSIKIISNYHFPSKNIDNIVIASSPRSGSTWLMELIWSQPGFKPCNEPLNIRINSVAKGIDIHNFADLYNPTVIPKITEYFRNIANGGKGHLNPNPFRKDWRFFTSRIVYKVINGAEYQFDEIAEVTNSKILFLIRHPFSVSLSRKILPRLEYLCDFVDKNDFSPDQKKLTNEIRKNGNFLEKAVLDWTIQNAIFLKFSKSDFVFLTYEELVVNPEATLNTIGGILNLPKINKMISRVSVPSAVTVQSDHGIKEKIKDNKNSEELCTRWKKKLTDTEVDNLWQILKCFELNNIYNKESGLPNNEYLLNKTF